MRSTRAQLLLTLAALATAAAFLIHRGPLPTIGFFFSVATSDRGAAERCIRWGADVSSTDNYWSCCAVEVAVEAGEVNMIDFLLAEGADVDQRDASGQTVLAMAVANNDGPIVERLLRHHPGRETLDGALIEAGFARRNLELRRLLDPDDREPIDAELARIQAIRDALIRSRGVAPGPSPLWQAPRGLSADRMSRPLGYWTWCALWNDAGQERLVVLRYPGVELFGTPYNVCVFDRDLNLLDWGTITTSQDYVPYALVEVLTTATPLPPSDNSRRSPVDGAPEVPADPAIASIQAPPTWRLAIVTCDPNAPVDPTTPLFAPAGHRPEANHVAVALVAWHGETFAGTEGDIDPRRRDSVRWAEPTSPPPLLIQPKDVP